MAQTTILRCSNMDQTGSGFVTLSDSKAVFSFQTPGWLRDKSARVTIIDSAIASQDAATTTTCLPTTTYQLVLRSNITSISFNSETQSSNQILGHSFYPTGVRNAKLSDNDIDLGVCRLPPVIVIERLAYDPATDLLKEASAVDDDATIKLCPMFITFKIEALD